MENLKIPETLNEDGVVSKLGQSENPCDKTLDEATGLSRSSEKCPGSVLPLEVLVGENGGGFDAKSISHVEVLNWGIDLEKGVEGVEVGAEEIQIKGVKNANVDVLNLVIDMEKGVEGVEGGAEESQIEGVKNEDILVPKAGSKVSGNGISLVVEVFGPPNGLIQRDEAVFGEHVLRGRSSNHVHRGNSVLLSDNGENPSVKVPEIHDPMLGMTQNGIVDGEAKGGRGEEEAICNQECEFSVGNLVWVKTKTQSWWPGLVFDPSHAPKDAAKSNPRACLLVKYFGNGNYVWCSPLQLKPFIENFEQMSAQGNSRNFLGAVEKAVDEFGRHEKLQMTCSCILKENQTILTAPLAGNGGSKEGSLVSKDKMCELGEHLTKFEPANFLAFVKYLAQDVSMPGMLEFAATRNRLSAFYRAIGHHQLPMHQLRGTTDVKDSAEDGLKQSEALGKRVKDLAKLSRAERDNVLEKCKSNLAKEVIILSSRSKEGNKDSEVVNGKVEVADRDICKLASSSAEEMSKLSISPTKTENKGSPTENDGGSGEKSEKGYESRERRRSKYLSPPYTNLNWGHKDLPVSEEIETEDAKGDSRVGQGINRSAGQFVGSPPLAKYSGKKLQKKWSKKGSSGHNTSGIPGGINAPSADMLSELRFAALDCLYPNKKRYFDSVDRFFSGFRRLVFHDKSNHDMDCKHILGEESNQMHLPHTLPGGEFPMDKAKEMVEESTECWGTKPFAGTQDMKKYPDDPGSVGKGTQERSHPLPNFTSKQRRRKKMEIATAGSSTKPTPGFSDVNGNPINGPFIINFQDPGCLAPDSMSAPKKRKKAGRIPELLQAEVVVGLPDLNGNCTAPSSLVEDSQATDLVTPIDKPKLKKRKRREGAASVHSWTKHIAGLADVNGNNAEVGSFLKDVQVMISVSAQDIPELNNREGMKGAASLYNQPDTNWNNAERSSIVKDPRQSGLVSPGGKPEPKKRKRKRKEKAPVDPLKAKVSSAIPDLNGNAAEPSSPGKILPEMNSTPAEVKPKRRRRRRNKPVAEIPDINFNYNKVQTNGEALGTALLLKFAQGFSVPSKEALVATFCGFGPLKESETQALNDSGSAQLVFLNSSDAGDAFRSFEKGSPFGPALVNYRLHLSTASRASEAETSLHVPVTVLSKDGIKIPEKPYGLKPHPGEAPDLSYIRKNLEMMTSMLEKAGDNLSPETRAKLETDIKGLLKKVSTMVGSSSSS